jgi:uncharacterized protein with FMN-binding domain
MKFPRAALAAFFALFCLGSLLSAQAKPAYADGSYFLRYDDAELGKVAVSVTVKDGKIAAVTLPEGPGDVALEGSALSGYLDALVAAPDYLGVDAVSGATQSCDLIKYAVLNALKPAIKK